MKGVGGWTDWRWLAQIGNNVHERGWTDRRWLAQIGNNVHERGWTDWRWLAQIFPFIKKWGLPSPLCLKLLRKRGCTKSFFLFTRSFPPFSISHFLSAYFIHIYHFLKTLSLHTNSRKERLTPEACDIHRETRGGEGIAIVVSIRYLNVSSGRGSDVSNATNKCIQ